MRQLLITGDSHCIILGNNIVGQDPSKVSRFPGVEVLHLGPALAYTLPGPSGLNAGQHLVDHLAARPDHYDAVMLCFGEIDARTHLVKQAVLQGLSLAASVEHLVDRYFRYIDLLIDRFRLPVFVWGPMGTMPDGGQLYNADYPTVGTEQERNHATLLLHHALLLRCQAHPSTHYIAITPQLIGPDLRTDTSLYADGVHLNRKGLSVAIAEIRRRFYELGFPALAARFPAQIYCSDRPASVADVSASARIVHVSSNHVPTFENSFTITNPMSKPFLFHTEHEDRPQVVVDLGSVRAVTSLEIFNRRGGNQQRADSLRIAVSSNRYTFTTLYRHTGQPTFGLDGAPLRLAFERPAHFRYIQLSLDEANYLHLSEIKVHAMTFLNPP